MRFLRRWKIRILLFFAVVGPGFITANVDNDAGGIFTYSAAGAQFGYLLLWTMIPITVALIVVQEMCARMGAVTGKGLSDLIREEFGLRITFLMMIGILITNFGNVVGEFAGIAGSMELFGVSKYISVPICAVIVWLIVVKGQYKSVEKGLSGGVVFLRHLHLCGTAGEAGVDRGADRHRQASATGGLQAGFVSLHGDRRGRDHDCALDAVLSAIVDCGERSHAAAVQRLAARRDRGLHLHRRGRMVHHRGLRGHALRARASTTFAMPPTPRRRCGRWPATTPTSCSRWGFSMPRFLRRRSCRSLPPTRSARAWASNRAWGQKFSEAPVFYWLYTALIAAGAAVILIPGLPLVKITVFSQVVNGAVLALCADFHVAADQQEGTDGRVREQDAPSTSLPGRLR